jgi:hypothetical protein
MKMEMQQMLERLLAGQEEMEQEMLARMKTAQEKMKVDQNAQMQEIMERQIGSLASRMEANQEMLLRMEAKMEAAVHSIRSELDEKIQRRIKNVMEWKKPMLKEMESGVEHQDVPKEDAVVKPVRGRKKQHRGPTASCWATREAKETDPRRLWIRGMLVAACRKVSHHAAVTWHRRNVFRNIRTQGNRGPQQELGTAGIMMTRHTGVAWCKGHGCKKQIKEVVGNETQEGQIDKKRRWTQNAKMSSLE